MADEPQSIERLLAETERGCETAIEAVGELRSALTAVRRAARTGDLRELREARERVAPAMVAVADAAATAAEWPLTREGERIRFTQGSFLDEVARAAEEAGLGAHVEDDALLVPPSIVRLEPDEACVTIDGRLHRQVRPSRLVAHLAERQEGEGAGVAASLLESIHAAYLLLAGGDGGEVAASEVHRVLTLLPSASRDYDRVRFARDLHEIDRDGDVATRGGARLRLVEAADEEERQDDLVAVGADGTEHRYRGIAFTET